MNADHETNVAMIKIFIVWAGTTLGSLSLSSLVLAATLIYTLLQIYVLLRKIWRDRE